jgi:hypothetical protein
MTTMLRLRELRIPAGGGWDYAGGRNNKQIGLLGYAEETR